MAQTIGDRIRIARNAANVTQQDVADHLKIKRPNVTQWETNITKPDRDRIPEIASFLECDLGWLMTGKGEGPKLSADAAQKARKKDGKRPTEIAIPLSDISLPQKSDMPNDIPVRGITFGSEKGDFTFNGDEVDFVRRPPGLANMKGVFGLYVQNDSMAPRYRSGGLILATAARGLPKVGDGVVVEMKPTADEMAGVGYVKEFVRRTSTHTIVRQYNPEKDLTFNNDEIKQLYRVLELDEMLGV